MWPRHIVAAVVLAVAAAVVSPAYSYAAVAHGNNTACEATVGLARHHLGPIGLAVLVALVLLCAARKIQASHTFVATCCDQNSATHPDGQGPARASSGLPLTLCLISVVVTLFGLGAHIGCGEGSPVVPVAAAAVAVAAVCASGTYAYKA